MSKSKAEKAFHKAKKVQKKGPGFKTTVFLIAFILLGLAFLPTSFLLFIGMLPSFAAFVLKSRASPVVAMNLAGCIPFVFKLWSGANDFDASFEIVTNSSYLVVMYMAAAFGYMVDWVVTGIVSSYLYQKGLNRMKAIKKRQAALIGQWGKEVAGKYKPVDDVEE